MSIIRKRNILRQAEMDLSSQREVLPPPKPKAGAYRKKDVPTTLFPIRYKRGELPCAIEHRSSANGLSWVCPLHNLDYEHYLPIFVDGIRCTEVPTEQTEHASHAYQPRQPRQ